MPSTLRDRVIAVCLAKPGAREDYPFGDDVAVFKLAGRMFALLRMDVTPEWLNLKCEPHLAVALREQYDAIKPGYHANKRHWNTVVLDGSVPENELLDMIDDSYRLVSAA